MRCWVMFLTAGMISGDFTVGNVPRGVLYQLKKTRRHVLLRGKRGCGAVIRALRSAWMLLSSSVLQLAWLVFQVQCYGFFLSCSFCGC